MIDITIPGEVPSKKNSRINTRSGRSFPSRAYTEWHDMAMFHALTQAKGKKAPIPCHMDVVFSHGDLRRRDSDNGLSSILDMLTDAGILEDDCWTNVKSVFIRNDHTPKKSGVRIYISAYTEPEGE